MVHMEFEDGPYDEDLSPINDEDLSPITVEDECKYINETYKDCEFPLDLRMFWYHQEKDTIMQQHVAKAIKNESPLYIMKIVEGVELIH